MAVLEEKKLAILDEQNQRIQFFDLEGKYVRQFKTGPTCYGFAVDMEGNFVVSMFSLHTIQIFSPQGEKLRNFGFSGSLIEPGALANPVGVAVDTDGSYIVAEYGHNRISRFDSKGKIQGAFGDHGSGLTNFSSPWHVGVDRAGVIFVVDENNHRVSVFNKEGELLMEIRGPGQGKVLNLPRSVVLDRNGRIYITDTENHRVVVFE